jgi:hypothetical protein
VPHDGEQAHQRHEDELGDADLPRGEGTDRLGEQRAAQRYERRVAEDTAHRIEIRLGRVELEVARRGRHRHHGEPEHPYGQPHAVEPQRQPHEGAGAGQGIHRATPVFCRVSAALS